MKILCACGCLAEVAPGKKYVQGHHMRCLTDEDRDRYRRASYKWISILTEQERKRKFGQPGEKNPRYKDGYTIEARYCIECGEKLKGFSTRTAKRCTACNIRRLHSNPEIREKRSKSRKIFNKTLEGMRAIEEQRKKVSGSRNVNWIDGRSYKPYDRRKFSEKLKEEIRSRDGNICQVCGMTEEEHLIVHGIKLSVHHADYNKYNCDRKNLFAVCKGCNARVNFNRSYWQEYFNKKGNMLCMC